MCTTAIVGGSGRVSRVARAALVACVALAVTLAAVVSLAVATVWEPSDLDLGVFDPDDPVGL
jgi:type IV secretory pathway protease TraF